MVYQLSVSRKYQLGFQLGLSKENGNQKKKSFAVVLIVTSRKPASDLKMLPLAVAAVS